MKAIKYLPVLFFISVIFTSCEKKTVVKQSLQQTTKDYFEVKDGSVYIFTSIKDTSRSIEYVSSGYINNQSNPDIVNNEILTYNLNATGQLPISVRAETNPTQYNDLIALITAASGTNLAGPILYNTSGNFTSAQNQFDSVTLHPTYSFKGKIFEDVLKVSMQSNSLYKEVYFAKNIGLIARKDKNDTFLFAKRYQVKK